MTTGKMEKKEFMSGFWRSCCLQGCFNYERQQGLGFGYAMIPHLRRIYKDDPEGFKEAMKRHLVFYNITPQCTTFVQGIAVAMEEEAASNPDFDASSINAIKTALMGPLSGIGDSIFWVRSERSAWALGFPSACRATSSVRFCSFLFTTFRIGLYGIKVCRSAMSRACRLWKMQRKAACWKPSRWRRKCWALRLSAA